MKRRHFLAAAAGITGHSALAQSSQGQSAAPPRSLGLGFSCYGMKSLEIRAALRACAEIGYDGVELALMPEWPTAPEKLTPTDREGLRRELENGGLRICAFMENLPLLVPDEQHRRNLARLSAAADLGRDLQPDQPPLVETVLGGRPEDWNTTRERMAERLADWARRAEEARLQLAIKAHVSGAAHLPEHIVWLLREVKSPALRAVFDYSHFELRKLSLEAAWEVLRPVTSFVHVKDVRGELGKFQFALPGEVRTDYRPFLELLVSGGYQGDVVVEVSAQIHTRPDYQPLDAARRCYTALAGALERAGIQRH